MKDLSARGNGEKFRFKTIQRNLKKIIPSRVRPHVQQLFTNKPDTLITIETPSRKIDIRMKLRGRDGGPVALQREEIPARIAFCVRRW